MSELFLLSNSRMPGGQPFEWAMDELATRWSGRIKKVALVPFAGVSLSWDEYLAYVQGAFAGRDLEILSVHQHPEPASLLNEVDAVFVGGGNTFMLTKHLHETGLISAIREAVRGGLLYMGWSAGANVACPTLRTTNDMPIVQPASFETFNFVPFQINPHYTDVTLPNHGGETRDDRIQEFLIANPTVPVVGLKEGTMLHVTGTHVELVGEFKASLFTLSGKESLRPGVLESSRLGLG